MIGRGTSMIAGGTSIIRGGTRIRGGRLLMIDLAITKMDHQLEIRPQVESKIS